MNATQLRAAVHAELCKSGIDRADQVEIVHWLTDRKSGLFYGSAMLNMRSADAASALCASGGLVVGTNKVQVKASPIREGEVWPPADHVETEMPKIC